MLASKPEPRNRGNIVQRFSHRRIAGQGEDDPEISGQGLHGRSLARPRQRPAQEHLGVDIDNDFETEYVVIPGKEKVLAKLKKLAESADTIYLAPDPDREGEAIAATRRRTGRRRQGQEEKEEKEGDEPDAHPPRDLQRDHASAPCRKPSSIRATSTSNLVDAQQARRVLDRLVGYKISPLLWDKVRRGLSAGRVQTVALRLIVEREREIKAFEKKEYWTIDAHLAAAKPPAFDARFVGKGEEKIEVTERRRRGEDPRCAGERRLAGPLGRYAKSAAATPTPPFTTCKLQQESSRKLRFSVKRTMMLAQRLYEGVELGEEGSVGLITYMRTDSTRVSDDALAEVREYIRQRIRHGVPAGDAEYVYKSKKDAQDAHEAIRPTSAMRHPDQIKQYLKEDEFKVYRLIWKRFVASQMMPAVFDQTTIDIDAKSRQRDVTGSAPPARC